MALNDIILNAVLETSDINKKLKAFESTGLNLKLLDRATNTELRTAQAQFNQITSSLERAKNNGFFGNKAQIQESVNALKTLNLQNRTNIIGIENQVRAYEKLRQSAINALPQKLQSAYRQAGGGITGAGTVATIAAGYNPRSATTEAVKRLNMAESEIAALGKLNNAYGVLGNKIKASMDDAKSSLNPLVTALNNLGVTGNSIGGIFGKLIGKVVTWMAATTALFAGITAVRLFITELKGLQDAQMRLQRVIPTTSKTFNGMNAELNRATKTANAFAVEMNRLAGASFQDTINALADVVKVGFSLEDSMMITKAALLAVNVAEMSVADATRYMTATIRQFNLEAYDSAQIIDQWNALSQKMGASTENIADATTRAGKAMAAVGATFAQVNAIAASTIEATGETGERIGTMLKTVAARYADIGRKNSVQEMLAAPNVDIEIYDKLTGKFNNIFDVLGKLAGKWDTLSEAQQASIAKSMAGIHHYSRFIGVMSNFDNAIKGVAIALDSQNSALNENSRRTKSLDFQLRQLQGSFSQLTQSMPAQLLLLSMTTVVSTLSKSFNILAIIIGIAVVGSILKLTMSINVLKGVMALLAANPLIATIMGVVAAVTIANGIYQSFARSNYMAATSTKEFTASLYDVRSGLEGNIDSFVETYRRLGAMDDVSKQIAETIKNIGGQGLFDDFIRAVNGGSSEITVLRRNIDNLTASYTILNDAVKEQMKLQNSSLWSTIKAKIKGTYITESDARFASNITSAMFRSTGGKLPKSGTLEQQQKYRELVENQLSALEAAAKESSIKGRIDILKRTFNESLIGFDLSESDFLTITKEGPIDKTGGKIEALTKQLLALIVLIDKMNTGQITPDTNNEDFDEQKKKYDSMLKTLLQLYEDYYAELYKKQKVYYDFIKAENKALVESFIGTLFGDQLKEGGFDLKNVGKAFAAAGGSVIDSSIKQLNEALVETMTGAGPTDMATRIEFAIKTGGDDIEAKILKAFGLASELTAGNISAETLKLTNEINRLAKLVGVEQFNEPGYKGVPNPVLPPVPPAILGGKDLFNVGLQWTSNGRIRTNAVPQLNTGGMSGISTINPNEGLNFANWWEENFGPNGKLGGKIIGAGMGIATGMGMNQKMGKEGIMGPLGGLIGSFFGGPGAVIGSMLGSWLDPQSKEKQEDKVVKDEQVKNARESTRQLKLVNRNLTKMIDNMENYALPDSYYFSVSRSRGLA